MKFKSGRPCIRIWKSRKRRCIKIMAEAITENKRVIVKLQESNRELENYVKPLEKTIGITEYKG